MPCILLPFITSQPDHNTEPTWQYGGHYIPQLSLEILRRNTEDEINFRGFLLGNPFVDPYSNFIAEVEGMYGHGLLPKPVMEDWRDACAYRDTWTSHDCAKVLETIYRSVEPGFNVYALDFPVCLAAVMRGTSADAHTRRQQHRHLTTVQVVNTTTTVHTAQVQTLVSHSPHNPPYLPNNDQYEPCGQLYMRSYLNQAAVQEAIHVKGSIAWSPCNININYSTADVETPTIDLYKELVRQGQQGLHSLRMLIYSGDDDSVCATDGTQAWLWSLGAAAKDLWRPWKVSGQVAGFWTTFDMNHTNASFGFATVHGAGHEVPSYRPVEALALFRNFIQGDPALIE
jgi:carboxypeptidase C (cathepsin A)